MPLEILKYVKEKFISLTRFLFNHIFFISAEMINSTEVNKLLNWYSYVLLPLFFFYDMLEFFCCEKERKFSLVPGSFSLSWF